MVKALLRYDLNDEDDCLQFKRATKARDALLALWDYDQKLRGIIKYGDEDSKEEEVEVYEKARDIFHKILDEHDINLDELIS